MGEVPIAMTAVLRCPIPAPPTVPARKCADGLDCRISGERLHMPGGDDYLLNGRLWFVGGCGECGTIDYILPAAVCSECGLADPLAHVVWGDRPFVCPWCKLGVDRTYNMYSIDVRGHEICHGSGRVAGRTHEDAVIRDIASRGGEHYSNPGRDGSGGTQPPSIRLKWTAWQDPHRYDADSRVEGRITLKQSPTDPHRYVPEAMMSGILAKAQKPGTLDAFMGACP